MGLRRKETQRSLAAGLAGGVVATVSVSVEADCDNGTGALRCSAKEWTRSLLRRVEATTSLRSLVHHDLSASELRGRPKKLAEILHHPICSLRVALFSALLVLKDAHRNNILLPLAGNKDEVGDKPPHVPDEGHKVFLHPPNHLVDRGRVRLVIAYSRKHIWCSFPPRFPSGSAFPPCTHDRTRRNAARTSENSYSTLGCIKYREGAELRCTLTSMSRKLWVR